MAKKFGKFLLCTAAIGTAVAAACYYMRKKDGSCAAPEDEDYDDFSEDLEEDTAPSHSYVPLNNDGKSSGSSEEKAESSDEAGTPKESANAAKDSFVPLSEQAAQASENAGNAETTVEEFFDEDDSPDEEPPISDN